VGGGGGGGAGVGVGGGGCVGVGGDSREKGRVFEAWPGSEDRGVNVAGPGLGGRQMDGLGDPSATVHRWLPYHSEKKADRRTGGAPGAGGGLKWGHASQTRSCGT